MPIRPCVQVLAAGYDPNKGFFSLPSVDRLKLVGIPEKATVRTLPSIGEKMFEMFRNLLCWSSLSVVLHETIIERNSFFAFQYKTCEGDPYKQKE